MRFLLLLLVAGLASPASAQMPDFTRLVREQGRVVVDVIRSVPAEDAADESPLDALGRLWGEPPAISARSLGAGFLISADGYIITNAHVVVGARRHDVRVRLHDRRDFDAVVVGHDLHTDVALLKIDADGLPYARIGDPQALQVGEWVAAIGSPFGLERSITAGIVSAKGRLLPEVSTVPFLQTDVAVNPGNSGGPLFNLQGEVIGVTSMIYTESGGYTGLSFAVPIDVAMDAATQLRAHGRVLRGRLGVHLQELGAELALALRLPRASGALVTELDADSPAARAGLRPGDVVVAFDGKRIDVPADLIQLTAASRPGTTVELTILRAGVPSKVRAVMADASLPERPAFSLPARTPDLARLGLQLAPLSAEQRQRLALSGGVLVQQAEGPAQLAGLRRGDLILSLDGATVEDVQSFRRLAAAAAGRIVALLVQRPNGRRFVPLRIP